jgi:hypothetical protein
MHKLLLLTLLALQLSCSGNRPISAINDKSIETMIQQKLGKRFASSPSPGKKYTLHYQLRDQQDHISKEFQYLILENGTNKLINEGRFVQGYIKWVSDTELELTIKAKGNSVDPIVTKINLAALN